MRNAGTSLARMIGRVFRNPEAVRRRRRAQWLVVGVALAYAGLLAFPGVLFAHYHERGAYRVWSDEPIDPSIAAVLDAAEARLARSPLYDPGMVHRLYICNSPLRMRLLARGTGAFGVTYALRHNTILNRAEVPADRIFRGTPERNRRPLSSVIAHERVHALLLSHYGPLTYHRLPMWKNEGYCEYVAGGPSFDPDEGRRLIREGRGSTAPSFRYLQAYFMVKYLLDVEHRTVDDLISGRFDEAELKAKVRDAIDRL